MAFTVVALYVSAATALVTMKVTVGNPGAGWSLILLCLAALAFIRWQFIRRLKAADYVAAATTLATKWLVTPPDDTQLAAVPDKQAALGTEWPRALVDEIRTVREKRSDEGWCWWFCPRFAGLPEPLTYLILLAFSALVVAPAFWP